MKFLYKTLILSALVIAASCDNIDEATVIRSMLLDFQFEYYDLVEYENNEAVSNDTIVYTFITPDSLSVTRKYYSKSTDGDNLFVKNSTYSRKYSVDKNVVCFGYYDNETTSSDYLLDHEWKIRLLSEDALIIDLRDDNSTVGTAVLTSIRKE